MMGIGITEMVAIAAIALVVIGPEKFPDFAKLVIRTIRDLRGYWDDVKTEVGKELKPLKKEMDTLSRIDPEKYIDSLTSEAPAPKPVTASNPSLNDEDKKVMAAGDAASYSNEDPYGWRSGDEETNSAPGSGATEPEGTVGYGDGGVASSEPTSTDSEGGDDAPEPASDSAKAPAETPEESNGDAEPEFDEFATRTEPGASGEPDAWTGR